MQAMCANTIGCGPIIYKRIYLLGAYTLTTESYKHMRLTTRVYGTQIAVDIHNMFACCILF